MAELDPLNARVLAFVLKRLPAAATGDVCWFAVSGAGGDHPVAVCPLRPAGLGNAVFTLGHGSRIYTTVTDADPHVIGAILARLEAEGFGGDAVEVVARIDDPAMREAGRVGVALLPTSASRFHAGLRDRVRVDDRVFPISMVHFLDEEEMVWAEKHGVGLLRERFGACGRNLLRFASASPARRPRPVPDRRPRRTARATRGVAGEQDLFQRAALRRGSAYHSAREHRCLDADGS